MVFAFENKSFTFGVFTWDVHGGGFIPCRMPVTTPINEIIVEAMSYNVEPGFDIMHFGAYVDFVVISGSIDNVLG